MNEEKELQDFIQKLHEEDDHHLLDSINEDLLNKAGMLREGQPSEDISDSIIYEDLHKAIEQGREPLVLRSDNIAWEYLVQMKGFGDNDDGRDDDASIGHAESKSLTPEQIIKQLNENYNPYELFSAFIMAFFKAASVQNVTVNPDFIKLLETVINVLDDSDGSIKEAVFKANSQMLSRAFLESFINTGQSVLKIRSKNNEEPLGTGFVVSFPDSQEQYFITNYHVTNSQGNTEKQLTAHQVEAVDVNGNIYSISQVVSESSEKELDYCLLKFSAKAEVKSLVSMTRLPNIESGNENNLRAYIIGYPNGGDLSFGLQENFIKSINEPYITYTTGTTYGCSGGPVLNDNLDPIAIHHSSNKDEEVNQGSLLLKIDEHSSARRKLSESQN